MTRAATKTRLPWEDRWSEPSLDDLLDPLNAQRRRQLELVIAELDDYEGLDRQIAWYGPGWFWTIQYRLKTGDVPASDVLCYLVPKVDGPIVCVPLATEEIDGLPMKRLNKMVRNGIRIAKCAVEIHWATWSPNNQSEINHLIDLIKRKYKLAQSTNGNGNGNGRNGNGKSKKSG